MGGVRVLRRRRRLMLRFRMTAHLAFSRIGGIDHHRLADAVATSRAVAHRVPPVGGTSDEGKGSQNRSE